MTFSSPNDVQDENEMAVQEADDEDGDGAGVARGKDFHWPMMQALLEMDPECPWGPEFRSHGYLPYHSRGGSPQDERQIGGGGGIEGVEGDDGGGSVTTRSLSLSQPPCVDAFAPPPKTLCTLFQAPVFCPSASP